MNYIIKLMTQTAAAAILVSALAHTTQAQQQQGGLIPGRAERERLARERLEREQLEQESQLLMMMTERLHNSAPPTIRTPQLAFAQIREDYVRLQVVNNDLARVVAAAGTLDLKTVAHSAAEIKKRADRLKENLALPQPESNSTRPKVTVGAEPEQLKAALAALDALILKLVRNPLFRNPKLVDARNAPQVRLGLEEIVELSSQVKKRSEQLSKAAQKAQ
ncbi:MAG TPA: hypothetical protein VF553_02335 [Pyrinomonadaceae bacterium]|jgi:hypothetical protein